MPFIDVSDVLTDPDFASFDLACERQVQTVGDDGFATDTPNSTPFVGVVTSADGDVLMRGPDGAYVRGSITVHTTFRLNEGGASGDADVVVWQGGRFTVTALNDYSHFGAGFVAATCTILPLAG